MKSKAEDLPGPAPKIGPTLNSWLSWKARLCLATICAATWLLRDIHRHLPTRGPSGDDCGPFPRKGDPFNFLPCTNATLPPHLDDPNPLKTWMRLYEPDPKHWTRGKARKSRQPAPLFLCGWLDVPLDYTNHSDRRIARLAVSRYQLSPIRQSERTIVMQPGGPGGSGTQALMSDAEELSKLFSDDTFDVLAWDPRGVHASQPMISCFPHAVDRDRWRQSTLFQTYRESSDPLRTMRHIDAMNEATLQACKDKYGDIGGMLTTTFVARDLEEIRKAMREAQLSGYFVSYGTDVGQTYVNMFPRNVGRLVLDGVLYTRGQRMLAGSAREGLDNITATFHDGFVGECVEAGPQHCALAQPVKQGQPLPTKEDLMNSIEDLFARLIHRPMPGYTEESGPFVITYSQVAFVLSKALYIPSSWTSFASAVYDLSQGRTELMSTLLDVWDYTPYLPEPSTPAIGPLEFLSFVLCADQYDAPLPQAYDMDTNGEQWYLNLWKTMYDQAGVGEDNFLFVLPCRHWNSTFGPPKEVYRGDLNNSLSNPVLIVGTTYDPATPFRNARRLAQEMGHDNARLIVHHGYGHLSVADRSRCTIDLIRAYLIHGTLPDEAETDCFADQRPYRYTEDIAKT